MKKFLLIAILLGLSFGGYAQTTLKVISFNIHAARDASLEQLAAFIKAQEPDIVALQEVDYYTVRSKGVDMLLELSHLTGMHGMFFPAIDFKGGKYGNAVLSKYSLDKTQRKMLSHTAGEQRCAAIVKIVLNDGTTVNIVDTHLDMSDLSNGLRQIEELNAIPKTDDLYVLGGDLNRRVGTEHINLLSSVWQLAVSNNFDHIAYYPKERWTVKETKVFDEVLSDHKAIMSILEIK